MKKIIVTITGVVVLVVCGVFWLGGTAEEKVAWETVEVAENTISSMITATGTIEPIIQVEVGTQVSGVINHIYVDYNSIVQKGQVIAEIDRTLLEATLASQEAALTASRVEYEYQQKNYNRQAQLFQKEVISDTEYETATYQYEKAKSSYEKNQADLVRAKTDLGYTTIYSPIDGVVLSRAVDEGQTVAASFNTPTLFTIANDLKKMQVVADVDEADIGQISEGQRVSFTVDAFPEDVFEGEVMQVRLEATTTSNVVTYEVIVNAPNPDLKLKPGLTANITIYTLEKPGILAISSKAFRFVPDEKMAGNTGNIIPEKEKDTGAGHKSVWVKEGGVIREKRVVIGISNGILTEITEGLHKGEEVVVDVVKPSDIALAETRTEETSPFMPKRPGKEKR